MTKLIIAGSRGFNDYNLLRTTLMNSYPAIDEIVSGAAYGADQLGERYAQEFGITVVQFSVTKEDWNTHGKRAGYLRNKKMAEYGTACVVFWDGESRGTKLMIDLCKQYNIDCKVVLYNDSFIIREQG